MSLICPWERSTWGSVRKKKAPIAGVNTLGIARVEMRLSVFEIYKKIGRVIICF
jgi:hypothetical protein